MAQPWWALTFAKAGGGQVVTWQLPACNSLWSRNPLPGGTVTPSQVQTLLSGPEALENFD